jgi:DNA-binding Xre family transcriptional regulator
MRTKTWKSVRAERLSRGAIERVTKRARAELEELSLRQLRQDLRLTQQDVAHAAAMTQSELSRLESRSDCRVSTLRRYAEALGGELEVTVVLGKRRIKLTDQA